jgi:NTE family protein
MTSKIKKKYKVGLVLSGGGARGFAHVGVLKALNEAGIYPDVISGVSAGAIVGVLYADGRKPDEIMKIFRQTTLFKYLEFSIPRQSLMKMTRLTRVLSDNLSAKSFNELKIPLYINATNLTDGRCEYFNSGELLKTVIASATVPVLFNPVMISGKTYVDGGVLNNFPIEPLLKKCNLLIGVNVNPTGYQDEFKSLMSIAERSFHLCFATTLPGKIKKCDIFIEPKGLEKYKLLDVTRNMEMFDLGHYSARKVIEQNKAMIHEQMKYGL